VDELGPSQRDLHDLNNIMCGLLGYIELSEKLEPEFRQKIMLLINRAAEILSRLSRECRKRDIP